jgi:hypothetical protein
MARRQIGGAGGGSQKAPSSVGAVVVGAVVAVGMAFSAGGTSATPPAAPKGIANKAAAKDLARAGKPSAWSRMGMRAGKRTVRTGGDCASLSTDQIRAFFTRLPCRSLTRVAYPVTLDSGAVVAVSVVWVGFTTANQAANFQTLHRIHGNGDVLPITRDVHFTALNYDSRRDGTSVVFAETETLSGTANPATLDTIAEVATAFPLPGKR